MVTLKFVLGIGSLSFLLLVAVKRDDPARRRLANRIGIALALVMRLTLPMVIVWIEALTQPVFDPGVQSPIGTHGPAFETAFSWRNMILIAGGSGQHVPKGDI